jgi:RND family efflux transporter MFP subunit
VERADLFPLRSPLGILLVGALALSVLTAACAPRAQAQRDIRALPVAAVAVTRGDIHTSLTYAGDLRAPDQVTVGTKANGRVERVMVDIGSRVRAGDLLAQLEQDSPLQQTRQARSALEGSQAKLAQLLSGGKAEDVAAAHAALIQQEIRLADMRNGGRSDDIGLAEAALDAQLARLQLMEEGGRTESVAQADAGVAAARARLALVLRGATDDTRQAAISAVDSSRAAVAAAEAALDSFAANGNADLRTAQSAVDASRAALITAETSLANLPTTYPAESQAAQRTLDSAVSQLNAAKQSWEQTTSGTPPQEAEAQTKVMQAQAAVDAAQAQLVTLTEGLEQSACARDPKTRLPLNTTACNAALVAANASLSAAQRSLTDAKSQLDQVRRIGTASARTQVRQQVEQAEAGVQSARARLETVTVGGIESRRAQLQSQVDAARQKLAADETYLSALANGGLAAQRAELENRLIAAKEKLKSDQARLDQIVAGPLAEEILEAQAGVDEAEQRRAMAVTPHTEQELRAQRAAVEQARLQLEKAQQPHSAYEISQQEQSVAQAAAALDGRRNPYVNEEIQSAQAAVDQARAAVEIAELSVRDTRIVAPVDGVVSERLVAVGTLASPGTAAFTLVTKSLEMVVNVEEAQLGRVAEGQGVSLQVPAYPDEVFEGRVATIAPTIDTRTRTTAVKIVPADPAGRLRAGMLGRITITTAARADTLVLPKDVLSGTPAPGPTEIFVVEDGQTARKTAVNVGLVNERFVEILAGVQEGQLVVTGSVANLSDGDRIAPQMGG